MTVGQINDSFSRCPTWLLSMMSMSWVLCGYGGMPLWAAIVSITCIFFSLWFFAIAKALSTKMASGQRLDFSAFKRVLIGGTVFLLLLCAFVPFEGGDSLFAKWGLVVFTIGQFWLLYCYIFILNFIAKSIATTESGRIPSFDQYASYFVCLFFFPIGIWFVHPRIKKLVS
jgi:hypothetical protein